MSGSVSFHLDSTLVFVLSYVTTLPLKGCRGKQIVKGIVVEVAG
jgi:hypothetical protein